MKVWTLLTLSVPLALAGCMTDQPTQKQFAYNQSRCAQYYQPGSQAFTNCQFTLERDTRAENMRRRENFANALMEISRQQQQQQMINTMNRPTTCRWVGQFFQCY